MTQTAHLLDEAITEALETMAFMTLLPPDDELTVPQDCLLVEVQFSGPERGAIEILAPADFCGALAQNIAATEDVNEVVRADALKEFCNVTCGLVLPRLAGSTADVFDMTVPSLRADEGACDWSQFCALPGAAVFNIEGFPVAARLLHASGQA